MKSSVILVAAGRGERLGLGIPKALAKIAGKTLLEHCLDTLRVVSPPLVVVVAPSDHLAQFEELAKPYGLPLKVVAGGDTRQASVKNGLAVVDTDNVLVHDAARCFAPRELFLSVESALDQAASVVPGIGVSDTIKEVSEGWVEKTLERAKLAAVQTPQGFQVSALRSAINAATVDFTDEAGLMEAFGHKTFVVAGSDRAFKVTTPADLDRAEVGQANFRTGIGTDAHQFSESGELVLGCLSWPEYPKLEGHSDGDSVAHAIVDALLTAAGLGDIGSNFGVDRPQFKGASGEVFISETLSMIKSAGFEVSNIAVQIVGDKPKVGPRRAELEARLSEVIGAPVSVAATTTDGLGFLSDARGVAAVATALLKVRS